MKQQMDQLIIAWKVLLFNSKFRLVEHFKVAHADLKTRFVFFFTEINSLYVERPIIFLNCSHKSDQTFEQEFYAFSIGRKFQ